MYVQDLRLKVPFVVVWIQVFFSFYIFLSPSHFLDTNQMYIGIFSHPILKIATSVAVFESLFHLKAHFSLGANAENPVKKQSWESLVLNNNKIFFILVYLLCLRLYLDL